MPEKETNLGLPKIIGGHVSGYFKERAKGETLPRKRAFIYRTIGWIFEQASKKKG